MNLLGIVQAYTALAKSLASTVVVGNIVSSPGENDVIANRPSAASETAPATPPQPGHGVVTTEKTVLPDAHQQDEPIRVASQSLIGLRTPNTANTPAAGLLSKLVTSHIAASNAAAIDNETDAETAKQQSVKSLPSSASRTNNQNIAQDATNSSAKTQNKPGIEAPDIKSKAGSKTASLMNPGTSLITAADQEATPDDGTVFSPTEMREQDNPDKAASHLQRPTPQTMAALMRNLNGQTSPLEGAADAQTDADLEEIRRETEKTSTTGQYANPRPPIDKRTVTAFIPPQTADGPRNVDHANSKALSKATNEVTDQQHILDSEALRQSSVSQTVHGSARGVEVAQASIGQSPFEQMLDSGRMGRSAETMLGAMTPDQAMGRMNGMDAAILNAAMIPGWPAPRPFEMPKKLPSDSLQRIKADETEKNTGTDSSTQQKAKGNQGRNETAIQNYLLNMGLKKSLINKLKNALRPARKKMQVMFGLAVLVTQVIFTLHTVLDELNQMEEDEDDMMHDPGEQKRRLQG